MKNIFRVSMLAAFTAVASVSGFAQDPCADSYETKQAIYGKFQTARKGDRTVEKYEVGIQSGEEFVSKYNACPDDKPVVDFIKGKLPEMKEYVGKQKRFKIFNESIKDAKNVNATTAFSSGREIIAASPDTSLDVALVLASIGFDNVSKDPPVNTFNSDTVTFAKSAIQQIEGGKTSDNWGALSFSYIIKDAAGKVDMAKSKENALAWMNYTIGYIMYYSQNMKKDALPYFYKASQINSAVKDKPVVYQAIGAWYLDEILAMEAKRQEVIKANENKDNEESLKMFAMIKGYADRAIDAYARAYKIANADPKGDPAYKKSLYEKLQGLYKLRFDKTDGMDAYIASVTSKPLPNPATEVTPVVDTPPATTTSTTSTTSTTPTPASTTTTTTKPATTTTTTTTTKPATTTTNKPISSTTTKTTPGTTRKGVKKTGNR